MPTLIIGTIPIWVMLLGKPAGLKWSGLVPGLLLTAAGLGLMMASPHAASGGVAAHYWRGVLLALAAMACWTAFAILNSAWLATVLWNIASRNLSASLCGQLVVSETLFALLYSFAWDGHWPTLAQSVACVLFTLGILASIKAHQ